MEELEERPSKIRRLNPESHSSGIQSGITFGGTNGGVKSLSYEEGSNNDDVSESEHESSQPLNECSGGIETIPSQPMSKSQLKKIRKKQQWEEGREYRKAKRKEKTKQKKALRQKQEVAENLGDGKSVSKSPHPKQFYRRPIQVPITVVLDCDFDELMTDKEIISLASQLSRCYSDNRSAPLKAHLVVSSFRGQLRQRFETVLANHHHGWKGVKFMDGDYVQAAEEANLVMKGLDGGKLMGALIPPSKIETAPATNLATDEISVEPNEVPEEQQVVDTATESQKERPDAIYSAKPILTDTILSFPNSENASYEMAQAGSDHFDKSLLVEHDANHRTPVNTHVQTSGETQEFIPEKTSAMANVSSNSNPPSTSISNPGIVYLTSDSPYTLDFLSPYTTYVIGGIVDKNRHKGICYKRACERGIPTARLPIGEYMTMQSRTVLATNHVVEIMVRWLEDGDWGKAFLRVIPKRKEAKLKVKGEEMAGNGGE